MTNLTFWFEFASTYSYLSAMRIEDLARDNGVDVTWRPFLLGPIFHAQGWDNSPFRIYPAKGAYMWQDMTRLTAERGLPFLGEPKDSWPFHSILAARTAIAALETPQGTEFCRSVYRAGFGEGRDIADPAVIADCLETSGLPRDLLDQAQSPGIKAQLRQNTDDAIAAGIFGAPSFTVGTELFWGDDRLDQAIAMAKTR